RVVKIIFMTFAIDDFHTMKFYHGRKYIFQQARIKQVFEPDGWSFGKDNLIQFVSYTFFRNDLYPLCIFSDSLDSLYIDLEIKLRRETDGTHHAQRIIRKRNMRV